MEISIKRQKEANKQALLDQYIDNLMEKRLRNQIAGEPQNKYRSLFKYTGGTSSDIYVQFHGTNSENVGSIIRYGFKQSGYSSMLGVGVYFTKHLLKAMNYGNTIITAAVKVSKVKIIDKQGHPMQRNWHDYGYDAAFVPENTDFSKKGYQEICVYDPKNIIILNVLNI